MFDIVGALDFVNFYKFQPPKSAKFHKNEKFRASKCVKIVDFELLESSKLISRKIGLLQKSWNFHIVNSALSDLAKI